MMGAEVQKKIKNSSNRVGLLLTGAFRGGVSLLAVGKVAEWFVFLLPLQCRMTI